MASLLYDADDENVGYGQLMVRMTRNSREGSHRDTRINDGRRSQPRPFGKIDNISPNGRAVPP